MLQLLVRYSAVSMTQVLPCTQYRYHDTGAIKCTYITMKESNSFLHFSLIQKISLYIMRDVKCSIYSALKVLCLVVKHKVHLLPSNLEELTLFVYGCIELKDLCVMLQELPVHNSAFVPQLLQETIKIDQQVGNSQH